MECSDENYSNSNRYMCLVGCQSTNACSECVHDSMLGDDGLVTGEKDIVPVDKPMVTVPSEYDLLQNVPVSLCRFVKLSLCVFFLLGFFFFFSFRVYTLPPSFLLFLLRLPFFHYFAQHTPLPQHAHPLRARWALLSSFAEQLMMPSVAMLRLARSGAAALSASAKAASVAPDAPLSSSSSAAAAAAAAAAAPARGSSRKSKFVAQPSSSSFPSSSLSSAADQSALLDSVRSIMPASIKENALKSVLKATMVSGAQHGDLITLHRMQLPRGADGLIGHDGSKSVFAQACAALAGTPDLNWRLPNRVWKVRFRGEAVDDLGGGYSESISEMVEELQSGALPLLEATPNGRGSGGTERDGFVFNCDATSPYHLKVCLGCLFRCVGVYLFVLFVY